MLSINRVQYILSTNRKNVYFFMASLFLVNNVGLEILAVDFGQGPSVHINSVGHPEAPLVGDLSIEVKVDLGDEKAVSHSRQPWCAAAVRTSHVGRPVKVAEVFVGRFAVTRRELVGKSLRADTVYSACKIGVGDGSIPRLDSPHGFAEGADRSRRVKDDLSPVKSVKHPVERVVAAVADVNGDAAKLGVKHSMPGVSLHVVGGLVEIPHPGDVVFPCNSNDVACVGDDDGRVPEDAAPLVFPLENGGDDDHPVLLGQS